MPRVLLVDDDDALRAMLSRTLSHAGFEVVEAENGLMALERMSEQAADVLVTDIIMPVMEGVETIQALRTRHPALQVIAISGGGHNPADWYLRIARSFGAKKLLFKPFGPEELLQAIRELLAKTTGA
jgi:CheY-like chemotaxis protein